MRRLLALTMLSPALRRKQAEKSASNSHGMSDRPAAVTTLPGMAVYAVPADITANPAIQTRPLPSRPNEEPIYNEADDSFSSGADSCTRAALGVR